MTQHHYSLGIVESNNKSTSEIRPFRRSVREKEVKPISESRYQDMFMDEGLTEESDEDY